MNQQRDLHRTHTTHTTPAQDDDDIAPGRGSRSSQLTAPEEPLASGLLQHKAAPAGSPAGGAASPGGGVAGAPARTTVPVLLSAIYEEVPGDAKDKVRRATSGQAVWLDPLTFYSNHPQEKRAVQHVGVLAGGGQRTVDTFDAPISEGPGANGRGSITAQLKYAGSTSKSFDVTVSGIKPVHKTAAEAAARKAIEAEVTRFGDVEEIIGTVEAQLNDPKEHQGKFQGAKVSIKVRDHQTQQQGSTTFNYKVRSPAGIRMDLLAQPVGEKVVRSSGSRTDESHTEHESSAKSKSSNESERTKKTEQDRYRKTDTSTETHDVDYYEKVNKTLDDVVQKATTNHEELTRKLTEKVTSDKTTNYSDHDVSVEQKTHFTDWTKASKHTVKSHNRNEENWASKLKRANELVRNAINIPFIGRLPFFRHVKNWQLKLIDIGLGFFETQGTAKVTDTRLDEKVRSSGGSTDNTDRKRDVEYKEHEETNIQKELADDFKSKTREDWQRHLKEHAETIKIYRSKINKDSETNIKKDHDEDHERDGAKNEHENEHKRTERKNQTTVTQFETTYQWKFTKPQVKATVVAGDAEVSTEPFGPDTGEPPPDSTNK